MNLKDFVRTLENGTGMFIYENSKLVKHLEDTSLYNVTKVKVFENGLLIHIEKEKVLKEFKVEVTETLSRTVLVEAYDECEAIDQVEEIYYDEEIILDADDFAGVNFEIIEEE